MKYIIALFPALLLMLAVETTLAANFPATAEVMVLANNTVELDVTMQMLDENAESSSDIINVIELPVQAMHQERLRNERRIRQDGDASPLRQEHGSPASIQGEIMNEVHDAQQDAADAKGKALDEMGQKKGR
ncbi:MAG: hypothetical protein KKD73_10690 [Proteobacteria bacterium]|nr:hypothetical protein [Pseudomonadota bacterium]MBU1641148.1 hypothetical protein [Pseudomonadota bacterium]